MPDSKHRKSNTPATHTSPPSDLESEPLEWTAQDDSYFLGAEAALPPGHYGTSIPSNLPDPVAQARVLRELQRRVRSTLSPAFPTEVKRRLPGAALLAGYRHFTLRSRSLVVDDFGRDPAYCERAQGPLDFLYKQWLQVRLRGIENLPADGSAILVCNHTGALPYDATMLMHGVFSEHPCSLHVRPLLEDRLSRQPYLGTSLRKLGAVRACQQNASRLLSSGALIAVFPEGRRALLKEPASPQKLQRFGRGGFVRLALRSGAPIIPVAIVPKPTRWLPQGLASQLQSLSRYALLPTPGPWTIQIGKPFALLERSKSSGSRERDVVAEETHRVRSRVASMIEEILSES